MGGAYLVKGESGACAEYPPDPLPRRSPRTREERRVEVEGGGGDLPEVGGRGCGGEGEEKRLWKEGRKEDGAQD